MESRVLPLEQKTTRRKFGVSLLVCCSRPFIHFKKRKSSALPGRPMALVWPLVRQIKPSRCGLFQKSRMAEFFAHLYYIYLELTRFWGSPATLVLRDTT